MATCEPSTATGPRQLTLLQEDSPVRTYPLPETARAWLETDPASGFSSYAFCDSIIRAGWLLRMCPAYYPLMRGGTLPRSFTGWGNSGIAQPGASLTLNISESPSAAAGCFLSAILETDVPPKYFLSPQAAAGILRRAAKRGRTLPPLLAAALGTVAGLATLSE